MATTRSLLGLDGKQRGLHAISKTASHVLRYISGRRPYAKSHAAGKCLIVCDPGDLCT